MRNPLLIPGLCLLTACVMAPAGAQTVAPPARPGTGDMVTDFGFWLGSWEVLNTRLDAQSLHFLSAGEASARIEPVLGGEAVLERWEGQTGQMAGTFGLSLRYFDESRGRWVVLLNWPGGTPPVAQFGRMEGEFKDGMIALHPPRVFTEHFEQEQYFSTRFVFSDAASDSCRWLMQRPGISGAWETTWSMDFLRDTEPDLSAPMAIDSVPESCACESDNARMTDWLVGEWAGEGAALRVTSAIRGCGVIASLEMNRDDADVSSMLIAAWDEKTSSWQARELGLNRPLKSLVWHTVGKVTESSITLRSQSPEDLGAMVFRRVDEDSMVLDLTLPGSGERVLVELDRP